jgi:hypothetical protein
VNMGWFFHVGGVESELVALHINRVGISYDDSPRASDGRSRGRKP